MNSAQPKQISVSVSLSLIHKQKASAEIFVILDRNTGDRGSTVVKVLCYKSEDRWFDPSWCH